MITLTQKSILRAILLTLRDIDRLNARIERGQRLVAEQTGLAEVATSLAGRARSAREFFNLTALAKFHFERASEFTATIEELRNDLGRDQRNLKLLIDALVTFPS